MKGTVIFLYTDKFSGLPNSGYQKNNPTASIVQHHGSWYGKCADEISAKINRLLCRVKRVLFLHAHSSCIKPIVGFFLVKKQNIDRITIPKANGLRRSIPLPQAYLTKGTRTLAKKFVLVSCSGATVFNCAFSLSL